MPKICFNCSKRLKRAVKVDNEDDEDIFLCRKCDKEALKELRDRIDTAKKLFKRN